MSQLSMNTAEDRRQEDRKIVICRDDGMSIELTSQEIYAVHRAYELELLTDDAESHFLDWINAEDMDQDSMLRDDFIAAYGFTPEDAVNNGSNHYLLPTLVSLFEAHRNCNVATNDTWRVVMCECMARLKKHHTTNTK